MPTQTKTSSHRDYYSIVSCVSLFPIAFEVVLNNQQTADYRPTNGRLTAN